MKTSTFVQRLLSWTAIASFILFASQHAHAADFTWNGTTGNGTWSSGNFVGNVAPTATDNAVFSSVSGNQTIVLGSNTAVGGLIFNNTVATALNGVTSIKTMTLGSGGITINAGAGPVALSGSANALRVSYTLNGSQTWLNNSANTATLSYNAAANAISLGANSLTFDGTGGFSLNGNTAIVGTGSISKNGTSTLTINGNNTFSGGLNVNVGTVSTTNSGGFGAGAITLGDTAASNTNAATLITSNATGNANNITVRAGSSGILSIQGQTNNTTYSGTIALGNNATLAQLTAAKTTTFSGLISGGSGLTIGNTGITNVGTVTLSNASNSYSGGTTVNSGTLIAAGSGTLGSGILTVGNGILDLNAASHTLGAVTFNGSGTTQNGTLTATSYEGLNGTVSAVLAGTGGLTKNGAGTLTLNGSNTYSGGTIIDAGQVVLGSAGTLGATTGDLSVGTLAAGGTGSLDLGGTSQTVGAVTFNGTGTTSNGTLTGSSYTGINGTVSAVLAGTGGLTKNGAGTLTLNNSNTYTGVTTISAGTLAIGGAGQLGSGSYAAAISNNGVLSYASSANQTLSGNITGSGSVLQSGTGSLTLSGTANTFTGDIGFSASGKGSLTVASMGNGSGSIKMLQNDALLTTANITTTKGILLGSGINQDISPAAGTTFTFAGVGGGAAGDVWRVAGGGTVVINAASTTGASLTVLGSVKIAGSGTFNNGTGGLSLNAGSADLGGTSQTIGGFSAVGVSGSTLSNGTLTATSYSTSNTGGTVNISAILAGSGNFTQNNAGKVILTAANTYTGATLIGNGTNTGTFQIGNGGTTGSLSTSSAITNNAHLIFARSNTITQGTDFATAISGTGRITQNGTGNLVLAAGNTFSGNTTVNGGGTGSITIGDDSALGTAPGTATAAAIVLNNGGLVTTGTMLIDSKRGILLGGTGGQINVASGTTTYGGIIAGSALQKSGTGVLLLSGANSYTGGTSVTAGTLIVNGSLASTGAVTVNAGATLGGNGVIGGATTINGNLAPGNSPGLLTFSSTLTLASTSTTTMQIIGTTTRGVDFDGINVVGALTYGGNLTFDIGTSLGFGSYTWNLFDFGSQSGSFAAGGVTLAGLYSGTLVNDGSGVWSLTSGSDTWTFTQSTGDLGLNVVPEPATWILAAFGLTTAVVFRRRRME